jgi:hypothetical protein
MVPGRKSLNPFYEAIRGVVLCDLILTPLHPTAPLPLLQRDTRRAPGRDPRMDRHRDRA